MLEIIALIAVGRHISSILKEKGHSAGKYIFFLILLWIGGEFLGAIIGTALAGGETNWMAYVFALFGAAIGAAIAVNIAKGVNPNPIAQLQPVHIPQVFPPGYQAAAPRASIEERLKQLEELRAKHLVNEEEYQKRRQLILNDV